MVTAAGIDVFRLGKKNLGKMDQWLSVMIMLTGWTFCTQRLLVSTTSSWVLMGGGDCLQILL